MVHGLPSLQSGHYEGCPCWDGKACTCAQRDSTPTGGSRPTNGDPLAACDCGLQTCPRQETPAPCASVAVTAGPKCKHCHSTRTTEGVAGGRVCRGCNAPVDTPATMLGEALEHIRRAEGCLRAASHSGNDIVVERALDDLGDARERIEGLKQDAERSEGQAPTLCERHRQAHCSKCFPDALGEQE